jgi:hypothetical protein
MLEFELKTRVDYNTEEVTFEGTSSFSRGPASANVLIYRADVSVLGGRESGNAYIKIPADIAVEFEASPPSSRSTSTAAPSRSMLTGARSRAFPKPNLSAAGCFVFFSAGTIPN